MGTVAAERCPAPQSASRLRRPLIRRLDSWYGTWSRCWEQHRLPPVRPRCGAAGLFSLPPSRTNNRHTICDPCSPGVGSRRGLLAGAAGGRAVADRARDDAWRAITVTWVIVLSVAAL